jgi:hypothetical protein
VALQPNFDLSNPLIEREFVRKVETLLSEAGDLKIAPTQHTFVTASWVKMWPKKVQDRWRLYITNRPKSDTISAFLDSFIYWLTDARRTKTTCENVGWVVTPGPNSSWTGDKEKKNDTPVGTTSNSTKQAQHGQKDDKKRKQMSTSSDIPFETTARCDVCNRPPVLRTPAYH